MKIWLDTLSAYQPGINDCTTPFRLLEKSIFPLTGDDIKQTKAHILQQVKPLYIQPCDDDKWLVCNPSGSGRIAVFDAYALALLNVFQLPAHVSQVCALFTEQTYVSIEETVTLFYKSGFLQYADVPAHPRLESLPQQLTVWLHVTNACNLRCHYCYLHKNTEHMTDDLAHDAIDAVFRAAVKHNIGTVQMKYAGGEASLHMNSVLALHDYALQQSQRYAIAVKAVILSNGVVLSQRSIEKLKSRNIEVMISLDGIGSYHDAQRPFVGGQGSFAYVARTIERLLVNALVPHIAITVSYRNLAGLPDLLNYVLDRDLPFTMSYYRENDCSMQYKDLRFEEEQILVAMRAVFQVIEQKLPRRNLLGSLIDKADMTAPHRYTCGVGQNYLVIDQHGGIAKCQADIQHTVTTIKANDPLQMVQADRSGIQNIPVDEKEGCRSCDWRYWCTGGCPLQTYRATGRYDVKSPDCHIYKALFPEILRLEALRLLRHEVPVTLMQLVPEELVTVHQAMEAMITYE